MYKPGYYQLIRSFSRNGWLGYAAAHYSFRRELQRKISTLVWHLFATLFRYLNLHTGTYAIP